MYILSSLQKPPTCFNPAGHLQPVPRPRQVHTRSQRSAKSAAHSHSTIYVQPQCNKTVLPEDDPLGLKHAEGFYSEDNTHIVHLLVIISFIGQQMSRVRIQIR
jgi:hypothetical protein